MEHIDKAMKEWGKTWEGDMAGDGMMGQQFGLNMPAQKNII